MGRKPVATPRFLAAPPAPEVTLELTLDREAEAALAREAQKQGTSTNRLAAHAVLVYLAELEFLGVAPQWPSTTPGAE